MPTHHQQAKNFLEKILNEQSIVELKKRLAPKSTATVRVPTGNNEEAFQKRLAMTQLSTSSRAFLTPDDGYKDIKTYQKNIENYIGTVKVPIGLLGPLRVNGVFANGEYLIPLATTEAALVASYNRGIKVITEAGGCTSILLNAYVSRCPCFGFQNISEVGKFLIWINENYADIKSQAEATTRFGKLLDFSFSVEGNRVFMCFEYHTEDASGQNMVTIATQAAFDFIKANSPVKPKYAYVEANMSGDKKATVHAFQNIRGRKVTVECIIPKTLVETSLHIAVDKLVQFYSVSAIGGLLSGTIGVQGHYANALAALYIACGQDAACVAESAMGITRFEATEEGDLYASVTLPNLMVGTVGGGTQLPSQKACLEIMGLAGPGHANALAEVTAALCLAGELSISAAMASDTFTQAHQQLARVGGK